MWCLLRVRCIPRSIRRLHGSLCGCHLAHAPLAGAGGTNEGHTLRSAVEPHAVSRGSAPASSRPCSCRQLINVPVRMQVSLGSDTVAHAELDLLPAATEAAQTVAARLNLKPVQSDKSSGHQLAADANITVAVSFEEDVEQATDGTEAPGAVDGSDAAPKPAPYKFVSKEDLEHSTVVTAQATELHGIPASMVTSATPAGGFKAALGLVWPAIDASHGTTLTTADWQNSLLAWQAPRRTFLCRSDFLALQAAALDSKPLFLDLARYAVKHVSHPLQTWSRKHSNTSAFHHVLCQCMVRLHAELLQVCQGRGQGE